jgi:16S rRNA (adenine1518-N6/adenine1519-N6)-dimethyltransferase
LIDPNVARAIVEWADVSGQDVIEIGPGRGALTGLLAERARSLTLVEIDPGLVAELRDVYARATHVRVLEADALCVDWRTVAPTPFRVVANLPYESGTAIVRRLIDLGSSLSQAVVMLQREVCERMTAVPGSKAYGLLSVHVTLEADVSSGRIVGPSSFKPRPQVESQLLRVRPLGAPRWPCGSTDHFAEIVRVAFSERRKMLRNTLGRWLTQRIGADAADRVLADAGVLATHRPETVPAQAFARIAARSYELIHSDARAS